MCRVLMGTKHAIMRYNRLYNFTSLLGFLEQNCGGQGNGVALVKDKTIIFTKKGVDYTYKQAARCLLLQDYDFALFHTRIASVSTISDANCHPFVFQKKDAMIMNGTISGISGVASAMGITDTECLFNTLKGSTLSITLKALKTLSPVFLGCVDGIPYAVKNMGSLEAWKDKELRHKDYLFASVFPEEVIGATPLPYNYIWVNGKDKTPKPKPVTKIYSFYSGTKETIGTDYSYSTELNDSAYNAFNNHPSYSLYDEGWADGYSVGYEDGQKEAPYQL